MPNESGEWIMRGLEWNDPFRIRTPQELINYINQVGFLPLFANTVPSFSVEEHVSNRYWWSGDRDQDPWEWREILAASGEVLYGKFFQGKAGFISREWFPDFANYRRDGYDFDARWEDGLANLRCKKIMDALNTAEPQFSFELKERAGFGKDGEKNFDGTIADLQMQGYVIVRDFRRRMRKKDGMEYGWPISVYSMPEDLLGYDAFDTAYKRNPEDSFRIMVHRIQEEYPLAALDAIQSLLKRK